MSRDEMVRVMRNNEIKPMDRLIQHGFVYVVRQISATDCLTDLLTEFRHDSRYHKEFVQLELFVDNTIINVKLLS